MDLERLKELKGITEQLYQDGNVPLTYLDDVLKLIDEAIARQTTTCPDCGGSGVYQEYDEYDRYTVHSCATCDGSGEIARQSATSEEVHCWYCIGIESHGIATVKTVTDEYGCELGAYDTPYSYCPNCGRKIKED